MDKLNSRGKTRLKYKEELSNLRFSEILETEFYSLSI